MRVVPMRRCRPVPLAQLSLQFSFGSKELFRLEAAHPCFEQLEMVFVLGQHRQGYLMRAPLFFHLHDARFFGASPVLRGSSIGRFFFFFSALGGRRATGRGRRRRLVFARQTAWLSRISLDRAIHRTLRWRDASRRYGSRIVDEERRPSPSLHELLQFFAWNAREHCPAGGSCSRSKCRMGSTAPSHTGFTIFVRVPTGGVRAGLGLAISDGTGHDEIGIVEHRAGSMRRTVAALAAFMAPYPAFSGADVTENTARKLRIVRTDDASRPCPRRFG